jgi:hypothetical protein
MRDYQKHTETHKNKSANALSLSSDYQKNVNDFIDGLSTKNRGS